MKVWICLSLIFRMIFFCLFLVVCRRTWFGMSWSWLSTGWDQVSLEIRTAITFLAGLQAMQIHGKKAGWGEDLYHFTTALDASNLDTIVYRPKTVGVHDNNNFYTADIYSKTLGPLGYIRYQSSVYELKLLSLDAFRFSGSITKYVLFSPICTLNWHINRRVPWPNRNRLDSQSLSQKLP